MIINVERNLQSSWWLFSYARILLVLLLRVLFIGIVFTPLEYCTIPTKCSANVTRDTVEHLRQVFEINKGV